MLVTYGISFDCAIVKLFYRTAEVLDRIGELGLRNRYDPSLVACVLTSIGNVLKGF